MEKVKDGCRQLIAGGTAGCVEICLMHPLDLVKTRLQIGGGHYRGLVDCFTKTFVKEGPLGFYKGILPPILAETPKRATKFFTFEQYKCLFESTASNLPQWSRLSLAGYCCGLTEAIVVCPFEVVKVRLQSEINISLAEQKSAFAVAGEIFKQKGLSGIYLGLGATFYRHGVWNMLYFGIYHNLKPFIPEKHGQKPSVFTRLFIGFLSGTIASIANIPFDVAKSRIQGPQPPEGRLYHKTWQTIELVRRKEGFSALYRGLVPKVMRLGPGGGIMFVVYETLYDFLKQRF